MNVVVASPDDLRNHIEGALEATLSRLLSDHQPPDKPPKEWLPNAEAQEYLGVSKSTLQRWRDDGVLPYSKVNGSIFYRRTDLLNVLEAHAA